MLYVLDKAVKLYVVVVGGVGHLCWYAQTVGTAVEHLIEGLRREVAYGGFKVAVVVGKHRLYLPKYECVAVFAQWGKAAFAYAQLVVGHHFVVVHHAHIAQAFALGAGALGRVERKVVRGWLAVGYARRGIHELLGEEACLVVGSVEHHHHAPTLLQGLGHTFVQSFSVLGLYGELVYHHFDVVVFVTVEAHAGCGLAQLTVDAYGEEALAAHRFKQLLVMALATAHKGGEQVYFVPFVGSEYHVDNALLGVFYHLLARDVGVGLGRTGIKQAQKVVYLGYRAYGGTRIFAGGFLLYAYDGAETGDFVDVGALKVVEKVARVGRECLDITALAFGVECVERERTLARTAQAGYDAQAVARQCHVHIFQVVHACAIYFDVIV